MWEYLQERNIIVESRIEEVKVIEIIEVEEGKFRFCYIIWSEKTRNLSQSKRILLRNYVNAAKGHWNMLIRLQFCSIKHKWLRISKVHRLRYDNAINAWQYHFLEELKREEMISNMNYIINQLNFSLSCTLALLTSPFLLISISLRTHSKESQSNPNSVGNTHLAYIIFSSYRILSLFLSFGMICYG